MTDSLGVVDAATHPGYEEAIAEFGVARSFETVAKAGSRIGGDAALVARYRAGSAYHPWHPFWLLAEDEYGMTRAGAIIMAGARPGMLWQQLGCVVAATPSDALAQARGLVGAEARIVALPTYWSKPRRNGIRSPQSEIWSGTSGQPTAPKKMASAPRSWSNPPGGIIAPVFR